MKTIGIYDTGDGILTELIKEIKLKDCIAEKALSSKEYDVLVIKRRDTDELCNVKAEYAVLLPDVSLKKPLGIKYAISCGTGETDTLTPSSLLSRGGVASLRRTIKTAYGKTVEPCEIELGFKGELDDKLAVAALKLILS
ncbi:MAG: hypothetical protein IJS65_04605 [Clostridia bacterium]|nr:hypothetical protein [Clostridia bacterium]